ncbi:MAG: DUF4160 domain-containing protein [Planctomycetaceae bacterium]|nr:DUF4160 domain-containing protein [Planctomycetaceae bacterium]
MSFFFWSNEQSGGTLEPVHIHICRGKPSPRSTKVWLKPDGTVELANNDSELSEKELSKSLEYVKANFNNVIAEWYRHFGLNGNNQA